MKKIYECEGRHFKVYNNDIGKVLEHHPESETVQLEFYSDKKFLWIHVFGFVEMDMRISGQKKRLDLYIFQDIFYPLLDILKEVIMSYGIDFTQAFEWKFGKPKARGGRQGVPRLTKLTEVQNVHSKAPFFNETLIFRNATAVMDSEVPGKDQTKWGREGGSRQIHFGIFNASTEAKSDPEPGPVQIAIPTRHLLNNFIEPIISNWID